MKLFSKYLTYFLFSCLLPLIAFAGFKVEGVNLSGREIYFTYFIPYAAWERTLLKDGESINFLTLKNITIDQKYDIDFEDTYIPCSWIKALGLINREHGWGIKLFINKVNVGTICANKKTVFDFNTTSKLEYFSNNNEQFIKFYNQGWWENSGTFPTYILVDLKELSHTISLFQHH